MRRVIGVAALLLLLVTPAFGAESGAEQTYGTSEKVRASVREAIRAGADPDEITALTVKMEESRFSERLTIRAHEIIKAARQEKLPVEPIMSKAYEGMAKRVGEDKTVQAMETVRSRYAMAFREARSLAAGEKQQQALGTAIAEGLAAGIQERDMERMKISLQEQSPKLGREQMNQLALQSFQTVREMARLGVSSAAVGSVICQALRHQFTARAMEQMRNNFTADARYGKAESVARQYGSQIAGGAGAGEAGFPGSGAVSGGSGAGHGGSEGSGGSGGGSGGSGGGSGGNGGGSGGNGGGSGGNGGGSGGNGGGSGGSGR